MKRGKQVRSKQRGHKHSRTNTKPGLAAHRAFAPLLGLWGAMLGAMVVLVLPSAEILRALSGTLMGTWGGSAQPFMAAAAAAFIGLPLFGFAMQRHTAALRRMKRPTVFDRAVRQRVTPINPARDLGTRSLDDPLEAMPFATPAWRDADLDTSSPAPEMAPAPAPEPAPEPARMPARETEPVELDLAAFAELPSRNAVWVEDAPMAPVAQPAPQPVPAAPQTDPVADIRARTLRAVAPSAVPVPGTAALARLRSTPASELSLVEMVERFAGALHEHREITPARALSPADLAAREAALAKALKALSALSGERRPAPRLPQRDDPLRAALAQLQPQRGAA